MFQIQLDQLLTKMMTNDKGIGGSGGGGEVLLTVRAAAAEVVDGSEPMNEHTSERSKRDQKCADNVANRRPSFQAAAAKGRHCIEKGREREREQGKELGNVRPSVRPGRVGRRKPEGDSRFATSTRRAGAQHHSCGGGGPAAREKSSLLVRLSRPQTADASCVCARKIVLRLQDDGPTPVSKMRSPFSGNWRILLLWLFDCAIAMAF